jgi:hypothetical protein
MRRLRQWLMLALWLAAGPGSALACALVVPGKWSLDGYDPAQASGRAESQAVRVQAGKGCQAWLRVEWPGVAGDLPLSGPGATSLRVTLSTDSAGASPLQPAPQDAAWFKLEAGREALFYLWARPLPGQWIEPGTYSAQLRLSLVGAGGTLAERELPVSINVKAAVRAGFAGSGGKLARLDFGELAQGLQRSVGLDVQANTGHRVTLESTQRGRLVNRRFSQSAISYRLRVAGVPVSAETSGAGLSIASAGQARHRIEVEIGPVEKVLAGDYEDDLLITITAQ